MGLGGAQEAAAWFPARAPSHRAERAASAQSRGTRVLTLGLAALPVAAIVLFGGVEDEYALPLEAAALVLGAGTVVARARRGERVLPLIGVTLPVLVLAALPALQILPLPHGTAALFSPGLRRLGITSLRTLSVFPLATTLALIRWLAYAAFLVAALEILRRPGAVATALGVVAALGVTEAVYGVGNLLLGNPRLLWLARDPVADATGTLVNRNHYAALFELCLPALLARHWLLARRRRGVRPDEPGLAVLRLAAATMMGVAVLLSRSRAGILCLGAGLMVAFVLSPSGRTGRRGRLTLAAVVLLALGYGASVGLRPVADRFAELPLEGASIRPALWRDTLAVALDFPLLGAGAGTFGVVLPAYRTHLTDQAAYAHAHQDYLELAAEGGLGALLLILAAGASFGRTVRAGLRHAHGRSRLALATRIGGLVAILLHAAVDFPLHIPGITMLLLLVVACTATLAARALRDP